MNPETTKQECPLPSLLFLTDPDEAQCREIIALYSQAGWWEPADCAAPGLAAKIVRGSYCFLVAYAEERIIGMGRVISDGVSDAYVQDVTVLKAYRSQGIGALIVKTMLERLHRERIGWVGLIAENNSRSFYENLGFAAMPAATPLIWRHET